MATAAVAAIHANIDHIASYATMASLAPGATLGTIGWFKRHHIIRFHRKVRDKLAAK